jgi:hypothetical protein
MKKSLIALSFVVTGLAFAQGNNFEDHKKKMVEEIEKRINLLQTEKTCIAGASDVNAVKACREAAKKEHEALRSEHKQEKMKHIDEKIKKLEEQKAKMAQ